jgi:CheY-like chemotaxis protein
MSARVLIVDDNESLRRVFSALLTQAGYQVLAALPDGSKLVDWMRRETPDIVCLDYHLPGRDGLSLLADIDKAFPQVDVLFMTASGEASLEQRAADAGAAGFLHKPFSQTQVLAELRAVCDARQQAGQGNARSEEAPAGGIPPWWPTTAQRFAWCSRACLKKPACAWCKPSPTARKRSMPCVTISPTCSASTSTCRSWTGSKPCPRPSRSARSSSSWSPAATTAS